MNFETIKKNNKSKIIVGVSVLLILTSVVMFVSTRAKYKSVQSIKLASGTVKINSYDFKIMAMYQQKENTNCIEDSCYDVLTGRMPSSGYAINEDKSYCTIDGKNKDTEAVLKTIDGHHVVENLIKNEKCYIWFDKIKTGSDMIIANIEKSAGYKTGMPTFTSVATGAETEANNGIYKASDGMYGGYSYYWRGAATTNHVIFDSKCWRIVRINGDKTIRLIYNGNIQSGNTCPGNSVNTSSVVLKGTKYNSNDHNSSFVGWTYTAGSQRPSTANPQTGGTATQIKTTLENWYSSNISATAKNKVVVGKFCNDRNIGSGSYSADGNTFYYAAYKRLLSGTKTPTLSCPNGDIYQLSVGLITADEVQFAGASGEAANESYYLYNGQAYWTMSPRAWELGYASMFVVGSGNVGLYCVSTRDTYTESGLRPVINLKSDTLFATGGNGTTSSPYVVET